MYQLHCTVTSLIHSSLLSALTFNLPFHSISCFFTDVSSPIVVFLDVSARHEKRVLYCKSEEQRDKWVSLLQHSAHVVPIEVRPCRWSLIIILFVEYLLDDTYFITSCIADIYYITSYCSFLLYHTVSYNKI